GLRSGETISFNLRKAYPNNVELASILHLKKEETANINSDFLYSLESISIFEIAQINQELFDKIYGEGVVTSNEQFISMLENNIRINLSHESNLKFRKDAR